MQLNRQTADNYGTCKTVYLGLASRYAALVAANGGNTSGFDQGTIDTYLFKVEHEFEKGSWSESSLNNEQGDAFEYQVILTIRQMNAEVRAWRKYWAFKKVIALVFDFQGNELLFGSDQEPLIFGGKKDPEQRITNGSFYNATITGQMRNPV
jgi:hypothetical protein